MNQHSRPKDFVCGALVGGAIAVLTSLLFTTKKGKEIQHKVVETCEDIEEKVSNAFSDTKEKASDKFSDVKESVEEGVDKLHHKATHKHK